MSDYFQLFNNEFNKLKYFKRIVINMWPSYTQNKVQICCLLPNFNIFPT